MEKPMARAGRIEFCVGKSSVLHEDVHGLQSSHESAGCMTRDGP